MLQMGSLCNLHVSFGARGRERERQRFLLPSHLPSWSIKLHNSPWGHKDFFWGGAKSMVDFFPGKKRGPLPAHHTHFPRGTRLGKTAVNLSPQGKSR